MLYYKTQEQYEFFEHKRYNLENIPTWNDIDFLLKEKELRNIKEKIKNKNEKIPPKIWETLIKIFQYRGTSKEIKNLRDYASKKMPDIDKYIANGDIKTFEDFEYKDGKSLLQKTKDINIESYSNMYEFFERGEHIGNCGRTSRFMGILFENPQFHTGKMSALTGTKNCDNGIHAWIETKINNKTYIIDTSMMIVIPLELKEKIGYEDTKRTYGKDELVLYDMYFNHYEELPKYPVKDKFSYTSYTENIKKLEKIQEIGKEL